MSISLPLNLTTTYLLHNLPNGSGYQKWRMKRCFFHGINHLMTLSRLREMMLQAISFGLQKQWEFFSVIHWHLFERGRLSCLHPNQLLWKKFCCPLMANVPNNPDIANKVNLIWTYLKTWSNATNEILVFGTCWEANRSLGINTVFWFWNAKAIIVPRL